VWLDATQLAHLTDGEVALCWNGREGVLHESGQSEKGRQRLHEVQAADVLIGRKFLN
jgi:hypothetical protein